MTICGHKRGECIAIPDIFNDNYYGVLYFFPQFSRDILWQYPFEVSIVVGVKCHSSLSAGCDYKRFVDHGCTITFGYVVADELSSLIKVFFFITIIWGSYYTTFREIKES